MSRTTIQMATKTTMKLGKSLALVSSVRIRSSHNRLLTVDDADNDSEADDVDEDGESNDGDFGGDDDEGGLEGDEGGDVGGGDF
ncbi:hypothetical protein PUNSTDRAFT_131186 [Punctularia strigosozonata HHB-11173 SS5]|uniref:uncharacterized protein n=1 Tax=Punctularia strigosozonata (strain HHB-11173) TaxID=741275 RepID=UPI0004417FFF|nr:uncharacterized protein PUNSTDRAFT_131186 [Punctularia strigosozonata HHB-11173 SS5]EIN12954.1 hypothetical protein PUNSTDRAFT_131186 [Punctularia strigosozonata HHB-11173 SS5]